MLILQVKVVVEAIMLILQVKVVVEAIVLILKVKVVVVVVVVVNVCVVFEERPRHLHYNNDLH